MWSILTIGFIGWVTYYVKLENILAEMNTTIKHIFQQSLGNLMY